MLDYLPIGLFGSVMGVTSLSVAWRLAHVRSPEGIALTIAAVAVVAFVLMVAGYTIKLVTAFDAVREVRSAAPYFLSQPT
jgi:tellurite resistance protein